jgi:acetylornithine/succinyldiaminopimelate/putrescine aminotransferase
VRTGELWGVSQHGIDPDTLVTAKGLSGGVYPIAAVLLKERSGAWLREDGFGHISTFGGGELGCLAALTTLEITLRPEVRASVHRIADTVGRGLLDRMATGIARARDAVASEGVR